MKAEKSKNKKAMIWLFIVIVALLAAVGITLALLLPGQAEQKQPVGPAELYWNIDGEHFMEISEVAGFSGREAADDGNYYIKFAFEGQQIELKIVDKQLVNYIDSMQLMGLVFDTDGVVVDAVAVENVAAEVALDFYVKEFTADSVTLNSSKAFNGMDVEIALSEQTGIWDVDPDAEVIGQAADLQIMDRVSVYANLDDESAITHIYISEHPESAEIYWRVERVYDTVTKLSGRVPDENGVYTMEFAHEGEIVELKCRDKSIVDAIDTKAILSGQFALQFDDEGYIVASIDVATALRGKLLASDYHITGVDGDTYTATKVTSGNDQGKVVTFNLAENCDIFQVCQYACYDHHCGERVESMQLNDRVNIYANLDDEAVLVFITRRCVDSPMYYNYARNYGGADYGSLRKPESDGYYHFEMLVDGNFVKVRAATKEMADEMDAIYTRCMGLQLNGDVVERVYHGTCVTGGAGMGSELSLTQAMGPVLTVAYSNGTTTNILMSSECKVYDAITGEYGKKVGGILTVQEGDTVCIWKNIHDEACLIYVTVRPVDGAKVYYNLERKFDTASKVTKREPNADGYYEFLMACDGKQVTVKTKSKGMASFVDEQLAPLVGLKVNGSGVITNAYNVAAVVPNCVKACNYRYTENVTKSSFNTYYHPGNDKTKKTVDETTWTIAKDCKIYNVSGDYKKYKGETTTLQNGDYIQAIRNYKTNEIVQIWVMGRNAAPVDVPLYYHVQAMYDKENKVSTRTPDAEGWYYVDLICNGQIKQYKTQSKEIIDKIDAMAGGFAFVEENGEILRIVSMSTAIQGYGLAGWGYNATVVSGSQVTITGKKDGKEDTLTLKIAKDFRAINVVNGSEDFGKQVKLYQGDKAIFYKNAAGELIYAFVQFSTGGAVAYQSPCDHCGQTVTWQPYAGTLAEGHYYLGANAAGTQCTFGTSDKEDIRNKAVLDLKGKTLTSSGRAFLIYDDLTVMDSVGGGKIIGTNTVQPSGNGISGACIMVANGGTLSLYGGELAVSDKSTGVGTIGGVLYIGDETTTVNMYGGKISGGTTSQSGGNIVINGGSFNMCGGIVSGGTSPLGDNIYASGASKLNLSGGTIDGGIVLSSKASIALEGSPVVTSTGVKIPAGVKLELGALTQNASVNVSAVGYFTDTLENAESYLSYIKPAEEGGSIVVKKDALVYIAPGDPDFVLDSDRDGMAVCPVCGGEEVAWTAVAAGQRIGAGMSGHFYIKEDGTDPSTQFATTVAKDAVLCIHMNGKTVTTSGRIATVGNGGTINIMGQGTITTTGTSEGYNAGALVANSGGTINLYDNITVTTTAAGKPVVDVINGKFNLYGNATIVHMDGGEGILIEKGKLTVSEGWTGAALVKFPSALVGGVVPAANGASTGDFTGTLTLNAEGTPKLVALNGGLALEGVSGDEGGEQPPVQEPAFVLDSDGDGKAVCPVCGGEEVAWTPVADGGSIGSVRGQAGKHYYLSENVTYAGQFMTMVHGEVCLHLNSKDLTYGSRMFITANSSSTIKNKLNIMGDGNVTTTSTAADSAMIQITSAAEVNLYGGTYKCNVAGVPVILSNSSVNAVINIHEGVVIDGDVVIGKGTLGINGASSVTGVIGVGASGKLSVAEDWTGTAKVLFENALTDGVVPAANGVTTGEFTGKLTLAAEGDPQLVAKDGGLAVLVQDPIAEEIARAKAVTEAANAMDFSDANNLPTTCPACGAENVTWTAVNGNLGYEEGANLHYYMNKDVPAATYFLLLKNAQVCLHLNGKNLTCSQNITLETGGADTTIANRLNIMGTGSVTSTSTAATQSVIYVKSAGEVNLYGGTFLAGTANMPVVRLDKAAATVNLYDTAVLGRVANVAGTNVRISAGSFTMYGGTVTGGGSTEVTAVGTGGNVYLSGVQLHMYGGTITGGKANYGGNVRVDGAGQFHLHGGQVSDGKAANNGGNVLLNNGKLYVYENGTISGGEAVGNGGSIYTLNAADVIETCGTIIGGKTTGQSHGGNVSLSTGASMTITGGKITNGQANYQGGNIHLAGNSKLTMTGGTVSDGTAGIAEEAVIPNHNIWLQNGFMTMTGGTVKGTDTNENGSAIYINNSSVLYLGGDAAVTNTAMLGNIYVASASARLNILNDWTGTASVKFANAFAIGDTVDATCGQCGVLSGDVFTPSGTYTGKLGLESVENAVIIGLDGSLVIREAEAK